MNLTAIFYIAMCLVNCQYLALGTNIVFSFEVASLQQRAVRFSVAQFFSVLLMYTDTDSNKTLNILFFGTPQIKNVNTPFFLYLFKKKV